MDLPDNLELLWVSIAVSIRTDVQATRENTWRDQVFSMLDDKVILFGLCSFVNWLSYSKKSLSPGKLYGLKTVQWPTLYKHGLSGTRMLQVLYAHLIIAIHSLHTNH